ncbi:hypothetical protein IWQ61_010612 [Dispira simplex]|nr:hypothetical protein IWQ61_010612 [Dispira simplex]
MTDGCEDDFVDISQQTILPRSGIRSKSLAQEGDAPLAPITEQPSVRNTHAAFAATMLGRLYELMSRCQSNSTAATMSSAQVTPVNPEVAAPTDFSKLTAKEDETEAEDYVTLNKDEYLVEDHARRMPSASNDATGDLLARFHKLTLGSRTGAKLAASHPSMHSVSLPFDITVAPE